MTSANDFIKWIKKWAKTNEDIRTVILHGSYAQKAKTDELSDVDLMLFTHHPGQFLDAQEGLQDFAPIWLANVQQEQDVINQIIIFEGGLMVDIRIYPLKKLERIHAKLPVELEPGYKVLVDKDRQARNLPKSSGKWPLQDKPTPADFQQAINTFWKDATMVAKYLKRGELWRAKHYDWQLKQHLMKMMSWHARICRQQTNFSSHEGKHLHKWVDPETYIGLMSAFGRFYPADSWRALDETIKHFTRLSSEVAEVLEIDKHEDLTRKISGWIDTLQSQND